MYRSDYIMIIYKCIFVITWDYISSTVWEYDVSKSHAQISFTIHHTEYPSVKIKDVLLPAKNEVNT